MADILNSKIAKIAAFCLVVLTCVQAAYIWPPQTATAEENGHPVVVALGDSFSSGEGTEPFYDQESKSKYESEDWLAHRSEKAWPGLLAVQGTILNTMKDGDKGWYFVASSGAKTNHILGTDVDGDKGGQQTKKWNRWAGPFAKDSGEKTLACQADELRAHKGSIDYVTLTMGGNDLGFVKIVETAVKDLDLIHHGGLKRELSKAIDQFEGNGGVKETLLGMYDYIHNEAGEQSKVIVAGYPHLFPDNGIALVSGDRAQLINAAVNTFDAEMRSAVASSGKDYVRFVDVRSEFAGREGQYMNDIMLTAQEQDITRDFLSSYSVHPNSQGHEAYARAVQNVLDDLEREKAAGLSSKSGNQDSSVTTDLAMSLVFDVSGSMDDWSGTGATKLDAAKTQSTAFVNTIDKAGSDSNGGVSIKVGIAAFGPTLEESFAPSTDPNEINNVINGLSAGGGTNIYAGLSEGIEQVRSGNGAKMVVLLSDGLSNNGPGTLDILDLADEAAQEGIVIFTIGFGQAYSIDEPLLQEIAYRTGGTYSHEDATQLNAAAVGLFGAIKAAQMSAGGNVVFDEIGSVRAGETTNVGEFVVEENGTLTSYLYWPGSVLDMILLDPKGVEVKEGYPGYSIDTSTIPTTITVANAAVGTWTMSVFGREVSMENEPFWVGSVLAPSPVEAPSGGGGSANNAGGLLILLLVVAVGAIGGVYALSMRKVNEEKDKELYG